LVRPGALVLDRRASHRPSRACPVRRPVPGSISVRRATSPVRRVRMTEPHSSPASPSDWRSAPMRMCCSIRPCPCGTFQARQFSFQANSPQPLERQNRARLRA
jgi:hypothetical protein